MPRKTYPKFPTATEAKLHHLKVEVGNYMVSRNVNDQQQNMGYLWQIRGPEDADGFRTILDDVATYREAIAEAKRLDQGGALRPDQG